MPATSPPSHASSPHVDIPMRIRHAKQPKESYFVVARMGLHVQSLAADNPAAARRKARWEFVSDAGAMLVFLSIAALFLWGLATDNKVVIVAFASIM